MAFAGFEILKIGKETAEIFARKEAKQNIL